MAGYLELQIDQGASYNTTITLYEANGAVRNLATTNVSAQMKKSYQSLTTFNFTTQVADGANGVIAISMDASQTANIKAGRYVYDVKTTDLQGYITRVLQGIVVVDPGVTN